MKLYANMHTHSNHSDGRYTPEKLAHAAKEEGYGAVVLRKFEKCRNTVCISNYSSCTAGAKDPPSAAGDLFSGSLDLFFLYRHKLAVLV